MSMTNEPHKIRRGDWVIFEANAPGLDIAADPIRMMHAAKTLERSEEAACYALHVLDATKTHLTVFDPVAGTPEIIQLSFLDGTWHPATAEQVIATWTIWRSSLIRTNLWRDRDDHDSLLGM